MPGPAHLKRLVLHLNTRTISLPDVTVIRNRGEVILKSTIANLGLAPSHNTIVVYNIDKWGRFEEPIGVIINEESNPKVPKLPYFISRLLGVLSLEEHRWPSTTVPNVDNTHSNAQVKSSTGAKPVKSRFSSNLSHDLLGGLCEEDSSTTLLAS